MSKWAKRFIGLAHHVSEWSEDESTKVGAVITDSANRVVALGFNGMPRGVMNTPKRNERPVKYEFYEHAERNAIYNAVNDLRGIDGATLYCTHPPCADCARAIIQSGIKKLVLPSKMTGRLAELWDLDPGHWENSFVMMREAGVAWEWYNND